MILSEYWDTACELMIINAIAKNAASTYSN